jgi:hypothetical protein
MSDSVHGKDVTVLKSVDGVYYAIGCATSCTFERTNELIGKTSVNDGLFRKVRPRISSCRGSVQGVTKLNNLNQRLSVFHFLEAGSLDIGDYKFVFADEAGNERVITMFAYVSTVSVTSSVTDFSEFDLSIEGSGGYEIDPLDPPVPAVENLYSDWWTPTPDTISLTGASSVHGYTMGQIDELIEIDRSGVPHDIIYSGTPSGRQVKWNPATPGVEVDPLIPFVSGDTVFIVFKIIT